MLAAYVTDHNFADPLSALIVGERPEPTVPEGWVRIKVAAASLNRHDLWTLRGVSQHPLVTPMILGCDGAGTLDDGSAVVIYPVINAPGWIGDETFDPQYSVPSEIYQGTMADYVAVPSRCALPLPKGLSSVAAASLGTAWLTAYKMLFTKSRLQPGMTMLVQGASGGISTALIQLGRAAGMTVWVTSRDAAKREAAEQLGAHRSFATNDVLPARVDAVFESVGEATWAHSLASVRRGGTIVVVGMTSGNDPSANLMQVFVEQITIAGSVMGSRDDMRNLLDFVVTAGIEPQIGLVLPLEQAAEGFQAMWEDRTNGKIVFTN